MPSTNGTHRVQTPPSSPSSHWERWQTRLVSQQYLTPAGAAAGFTLLKFPPSMRAVFFDLVRLIIARSRLEEQLPHLVADAANVAAMHEAMTAWTARQRYTVRLARAFEQRAHGRLAALPPVPPEVQALAVALDDVPGDDNESEATA